MAEAVRQVATSAILVSHILLLYIMQLLLCGKTEKGNNKSRSNVEEVDEEGKGHVG